MSHVVHVLHPFPKEGSVDSRYGPWTLPCVVRQRITRNPPDVRTATKKANSAIVSIMVNPTSQSHRPMVNDVGPS